MTEHERQDDLTQRYREASAQDERRPGAHVREAVRAHAQMVLDGQRHAQAAQALTVTPAPAANQSRWKVSAFATVALVGLAGLLVLQFERGAPEEKDIAFGQPRAEAPQATPTTPAAPARPSARAAPAPGAAEPLKEQTAPPVEKSAARKPAVPPPLADAPPGPTPASGTLSPAPAPAPAAAAEPEQAKARAPSTARDTTAFRDLRSGADATASRAAPAPAAGAAAATAPAPEQPGGQGMSAPPRLRADVASPQTPADALLAAARSGQVTQLEALARQGAPLNTADENGRTPLMLAVINGHAAAVKKLLALGANPAQVDRHGLNALQHARKLGFTQIAALIEAGF